jgi:L-asparaginase
MAGFAPGLVTPGERAALEEMIASGVAVVQATRSISGRVIEISDFRPQGIVVSDNLSPQKARVLLMLALAHGADTPEKIADAFQRY